MKQDIMDLIAYQDSIDRLILDSDQSKVMLNGSVEHAAIIVERMFARADQTVRVLSRRLDPAIYADEDVMEQLQCFVNNPARSLKILVETASEEALSVHPMAKFSQTFPNIEMRRVPEYLSQKLKFNFSLMDNAGYRFEEDKQKVNAVVSFGNIKFSSALGNYFDNIWNVSAPVPSVENCLT